MVTNGVHFKLIRNGRLYAPEDLGVQDLFIAGEKIAGIGRDIELQGLEVEVFDASGLIVVPGFIDLHVHLIGGGGEAGPASRVPEIPLSQLTEAGLTTVVGVLGTDNVTRQLETLLAKVKALRMEGISAFMYTGSYHLPSATITGSVKRDIALIDEIIGVKIAISDHRNSQPTTDELDRLASEARVGGMLGSKAGLVHLHVGEGSQGLRPILNTLEQTDIPIRQFLPTHLSRTPQLLEEGIAFAKMGGNIDLTAPSPSLQWETGITEAIEIIMEKGVGLEQVTLSSDGNGSMPRFDERGHLVGLATGAVGSLSKAMKALVDAELLSLPDALSLISRNPADRLHLLGSKGQIAEGHDADILILDENLALKRVYARGRLMVKGGQAVVKGMFE